MVTKGIIKSIDLLGNTCTVHIPFFETAGNDPIIETATVSNTPGSYNGYKVGDVVYVAFEDGSMSTPVVIGKLFLGTEKEKADPRGVSNVEESSAAKKATLPADSKLTAEIDSNVPNTTVPYSSLSSIANGLNKLNTDVGQMDRDYGNRFKQVITDIEGNKSTLEQTANRMVAKVSGSKYQTDENGNILYDKDNKPIPDPEAATEEFGWELQKDKWTITSNNKEVLAVNSEGLKVKGDITAETGHLGKFIIGGEHVSKLHSGDTESGIYTDDFIKCFMDDVPTETTQDENGNWIDSYKPGVYIGTDGIRLGGNFSVDSEGKMTASELTLVTQNIEQLDADTKTALEELGDSITAVAQGKSTNYYSDTDPADDPKYVIKAGDCWFCTKNQPSYTEYQTFANLPEYVGYYIKDRTNYYEVTVDNLGQFDPQESGGEGLVSIIVGTTIAYKKELKDSSPTLYQWKGKHSNDTSDPGGWEDIGGELVANKVTANYINTLGITAQKVTVLDKTGGKLFEANGTAKDGQGNPDPYVQIAGFDVKQNTLTTGGTKSGNLIQLNSDSASPYSFYALTEDEYLDFIYDYTEDISIKPFQKSDSLWYYDDNTQDVIEGKYYLAFSAENASTVPFQYAITKVTFTKDITSNFRFYIRDTSTQTEDYVIISSLGADKVPTSSTSPGVVQSTKNKGISELISVTFAASPESPIGEGAYFYIVYRHRSTDSNKEYKGQVYLPVDIRMSIGENFQVLADGSVYAKNLFLGGVSKEISPTYSSADSNWGENNASGQLAAISAKLNHIEVRDEDELDNSKNILLKADGRSNSVTKEVQIGGFKVAPGKLVSGEGNTYVSLGVDALLLGGDSKDTATFSVTSAGDVTAKSANIGAFNFDSNYMSGAGLQLGDGSLVLNGDSSMTLGVADKAPYIEFNGKGKLIGSGGCGFLFGGENTSQIQYFRARIESSTTDGNTATAVVRAQIQRTNGAWEDINEANPEELTVSCIVYLRAKGQDSPWIGNATTIYSTKSIQLSKNQIRGTVTFTGDFDKLDDVFFVGSGRDSATAGGHESRTWGDYSVAANILTSLGSIVPQGPYSADATYKYNLGSSSIPWHNVYAGTATLNSSAQLVSDRKLKNTINYDISNYDLIFDTLKPVSYKYNDATSDRTHLGFIAQDIRDSIQAADLTTKDYAILTIEGEGFDSKQGIVTDEEKTTYRLRYDEFHALEVRQIQLLKEQVKQQEARITELEEIIKNLKN